MLLLCALLPISCGGGADGSGVKVEIDGTVTDVTLVKKATVLLNSQDKDGKHVEPSMFVSMDVPDESKVIRFKDPKVDFAFYCNGSSQVVSGAKCVMHVEEGRRIFGFRHALTAEQRRTLQKVVINRLYE